MSKLSFHILKIGKKYTLIKVGGGNVVGYIIIPTKPLKITGCTTQSEAWDEFYELEMNGD